MNRAPVQGEPRDVEATRPTLSGIVPAQRKRLPEEVADHLLELIAASDEDELSLPTERQLCERLGVSRNVVREALSALDHVGVIETHGKRRVALTARAHAQLVARVPNQRLTRELMLEPIELRLILEPAAAALAAERATAADLAEIERYLEAMADAIRSGGRFVEQDSAFHVAIARAANNDMLADLIGALADALRPSRELSFKPSGAAEAALADHRKIFAAISARDAQRAHEAMVVHLRHVGDLIRSTLTAG